MKYAIATLIGVVILRVAGASIFQNEVDFVVTNDILRCVHDEDVEFAEAELKRQGASNEMIARAYYSAVQRTKNAQRFSDEAAMFQSAAYGFSKIADIHQLTNLLWIAETSTNDCNAVTAVTAFYSRHPSSLEFVRWGVGALRGTNSTSRVKSTVWALFSKTMQSPELRSDVRSAIMEQARNAMSGNLVDMFYADHILSENDRHYRDGKLRRQMMQRAIKERDMNGVDQTIRKYFLSIVGDVAIGDGCSK